MTAPLLGRLGIEIELLAPLGRTRRDLADAIAERYGGTVRRFFHPQSEPSSVPNTPVFENLTLGFQVEGPDGELLARCVDDLTLQDDLEKKHPPQPGWYRIVSDDLRFLRLVMRHCDPAKPLATVLEPIAMLFGSEVNREGGMVRVADEANTPIVLGAPLPGQRERPCELITPPLDGDHSTQLEALLRMARDLDFSLPLEGATHLHFDAAPLCDASTMANLIRYLSVHRESLRTRFAVNSRCRRLGAWPEELLDTVSSPEFVALRWEEARTRLRQVKLTKYCDFNLQNIVRGDSNKHTLEVRILPSHLETEPILEAAAIVASIIAWARGGRGRLLPVPEDLDRLVDS